VDSDLFGRLRLGAEARGADGIADLAMALSLVGGPSFDQLRKRWLRVGDRRRAHIDHHLVCAIADVAHVVTTHDLAAGNLKGARAAAEIAQLAPSEEIPRLHLVAVRAAEGHREEAEDYRVSSL